MTRTEWLLHGVALTISLATIICLLILAGVGIGHIIQYFRLRQ